MFADAVSAPLDDELIFTFYFQKSLTDTLLTLPVSDPSDEVHGIYEPQRSPFSIFLSFVSKVQQISKTHLR